MIDEGFKEQLMGALKAAVQNVNGGLDVNAAVTKAAADADFNREQTCRLCETFNTARTIYHFESQPAEKTAAFALADKEKVLAQLFGAAEKAAGAEYIRPAIPDYREYDGRELDAHMGKAASLQPLWGAADAALPDLEAQARRLTRIVRSQEKMADHAASEARCAREHANLQTIMLVDDMCHDFWTSGNTKYARLIRCYDDKPEYKPVLETLEAYMPEYMKAGEAVLAAQGNVVDDTDLDWHKGKMDEIKDAMEGAANLDALGLTVAKEAKEASAAFEALVVARPEPEHSEFEEFFAPNFKRAETVTTTKGTSYSLGQLLGDKDPSEQTTQSKSLTLGGVAKSLTDASAPANAGIDALLGTGTADLNKQITERLRNQQREVLMQDLMLNDPFISDADPQTVAALYTQIMQIAPEVSLNREVVRGVLRQGLHNVTAVSPFDAQAWGDLEKTIREVQGTLPGKGPMKPGGGK